MSPTELETRSPKAATDLNELAQDLVRRAMAGGASAAEAVVREGDEFSTTVRLGQVETLKESGSRAVGIRVFFGKRAASTYSSDFSREGLDRMLKSALELAKITSEDPFGGIPEATQLGSLQGDLDLYHEDVYSLPGAERIDYARRAEKAALDFDPRIKNSEGGSFDAATGRKVLANSHGFVGEYRRSYCSVAAIPIAQDDKGAMQRDYWFSVARNLMYESVAYKHYLNIGLFHRPHFIECVLTLLRFRKFFGRARAHVIERVRIEIADLVDIIVTRK